MSEHAIDQLTWSRPALQRTEVGPMMHDYAHRLYEEVEVHALSNLDTFTVPQSVSDLAVYVNHLRRIATDTVEADYTDPRQQAILAYLAGNQESNASHRPPTTRNITTVQSSVVFDEALGSGIYLPAYLYVAIDACENWGLGSNLSSGYLPRPRKHEINPVDFAERIVSPIFLRMLHELAYAPNGFLSNGSNTTALVEPQLLSCFWMFAYQEGKKEIFELDDKGSVTGFSAAFLTSKRNQIRESNSSESISLHTGGCPVRHASFKKIGENALEYLDGERPLNEGVSAITRAAQLLGTAVSAGFKPKEELQTTQ